MLSGGGVNALGRLPGKAHLIRTVSEPYRNLIANSQKPYGRIIEGRREASPGKVASFVRTLEGKPAAGQPRSMSESRRRPCEEEGN